MGWGARSGKARFPGGARAARAGAGCRPLGAGPAKVTPPGGGRGRRCTPAIYSAPSHRPVRPAPPAPRKLRAKNSPDFAAPAFPLARGCQSQRERGFFAREGGAPRLRENAGGEGARRASTCARGRHVLRITSGAPLRGNAKLPPAGGEEPGCVGAVARDVSCLRSGEGLDLRTARMRDV